jgi:hypothetical protein
MEKCTRCSESLRAPFTAHVFYHDGREHVAKNSFFYNKDATVVYLCSPCNNRKKFKEQKFCRPRGIPGKSLKVYAGDKKYTVKDLTVKMGRGGFKMILPGPVK